MNNGEILPFHLRHCDARRRFGQRLRGVKRERQMRDGCAEFGARGAVPGVNFVKGFERVAFCIVDDADQVKAGIGDGSGFIGETDKGKNDARGPYFGVIRANGFQGRK
jgi:hypothetical protein